MVWYPNVCQQVTEGIVVFCEEIDSIIVYIHLPTVQLTLLNSGHNFSEYEKQLWKNIIHAKFEEFGSVLVSKYAIPTKADLFNSSKYHPLPWNPIVSMSKNDDQSILSFNEQKYAISICKKQLIHI